MTPRAAVCAFALGRTAVGEAAEVRRDFGAEVSAVLLAMSRCIAPTRPGKGRGEVMFLRGQRGSEPTVLLCFVTGNHLNKLLNSKMSNTKGETTGREYLAHSKPLFKKLKLSLLQDLFRKVLKTKIRHSPKF